MPRRNSFSAGYVYLGNLDVKWESVGSPSFEAQLNRFTNVVQRFLFIPALRDAARQGRDPAHLHHAQA
jgi:hypothetical protein